MVLYAFYEYMGVKTVETRRLLVGALWCSGSRSRLSSQRVRVRIPLGAYALRQGILSTIVSLDPGVVNGYPAEFIPSNALSAERLHEG